MVIKGVEPEAYRRLKARAATEGMKIGQAASHAFKAWVQEPANPKFRDIDRMRRAAQIMDRNRSKLRQLKTWSSVKVIREWRRRRRTR